TNRPVTIFCRSSAARACIRAGISSDRNSSRRSGIDGNVKCCVARLPSKGARGCHHTLGLYQPPPPPPPPPPEPPPSPENPEEPDEAGSALAKASLMLATDDDTALLKLLPNGRARRGA